MHVTKGGMKLSKKFSILFHSLPILAFISGGLANLEFSYYHLINSILNNNGVFLIFSIFLLFFFLKFSITGRVGTHRNDFFYFLSFSGIPNLFWLKKKQ